MTALRRLKGFRIAWIRLKLVESKAAVVDMIERCSSLFGLTKTSCCRHAMGYGLRRKAMSCIRCLSWFTSDGRNRCGVPRTRSSLKIKFRHPRAVPTNTVFVR